MQKTIKQIKENLNRVVQEYVVTKPFPADNDVTFQDIDLIDPNLDVPQRIKRAIPFLSKNKTSDQTLLYNAQKQEVVVANPDELTDYIELGYKTIYEEVTTANVSGADAPYTDTSGDFDKVGGYNKVLMGMRRNAAQLGRYNGRKFKLPSNIFKKLKKKGKRKFKRFEEEAPIELKKYSMRNPDRPVVIQDEETGEVAFYRRNYGDGRLIHNRRK